MNALKRGHASPLFDFFKKVELREQAKLLNEWLLEFVESGATISFCKSRESKSSGARTTTLVRELSTNLDGFLPENTVTWNESEAGQFVDVVMRLVREREGKKENHFVGLAAKNYQAETSKLTWGDVEHEIELMEPVLKYGTATLVIVATNGQGAVHREFIGGAKTEYAVHTGGVVRKGRKKDVGSAVLAAVPKGMELVLLSQAQVDDFLGEGSLGQVRSLFAKPRAQER